MGSVDSRPTSSGFKFDAYEKAAILLNVRLNVLNKLSEMSIANNANTIVSSLQRLSVTCCAHGTLHYNER